jgi:hypothetical protein
VARPFGDEAGEPNGSGSGGVEEGSDADEESF